MITNFNIEKFQKLSNNLKIEKIKTILNFLKDKNIVFNNFYEIFINIDNFSDNFLITFYHSLINEFYLLEEKEFNQVIQKINLNKEKIKNISKQEKIDKEDVEYLLYNL